MRLYRAVLFGTAIGDALGLPYEGTRPRDATSGGRVVSDDTDQTALVAECLARHGGDRDACVRAFRRALAGWFLALPWGIGWGTLRACIRIVFGLRRSGVASAGNGAAMRAAIVGAVMRDRSRDERVAWIDALSEVTHLDRRAVEGARFVAELAAVHDGRRALEGVDEPTLRAALVRAIELAEEGASVDHAADVLGTSGYVVESVPLATFCALRFDPERAVHEAVLAGGDTDTNAAIAGALAGAIHGDVWPASRCARLFVAPHLDRLARDLDEGTSARSSWALALIKNAVSFPIVVVHAVRARLPRRAR